MKRETIQKGNNLLSEITTAKVTLEGLATVRKIHLRTHNDSGILTVYIGSPNKSELEKQIAAQTKVYLHNMQVAISTLVQKLEIDFATLSDDVVIDTDVKGEEEEE